MLNISKRHIVKTISWRIIGTVDTMLLSWFISDDLIVGLKIGGVELITKMILYYIHERAWFNYRFDNTNKRHLLKTVSWRIIGSSDTIILGWLISGNHIIALKIGVMEVFTKMLLYFVHEKLWYRINFGLNKIRRGAKGEITDKLNSHKK